VLNACRVRPNQHRERRNLTGYKLHPRLIV